MGRINLQEKCGDKSEGIPPQLRLRVEMLLLILDDIESQRKRLELDESKYLSLRKVEELFSTMNKAHYYLHEVQKYVQLELWGKPS